MKCTIFALERSHHMHLWHAAFSIFITSIQVNFSRLKACGSQSFSSCRKLVELTSFRLSNPLNRLDCSVLLAAQAERVNIEATVVAPNIPV